MPLQVTEMFAFLGFDDEGDEGIMAAPIGDMIMPLIGADLERIGSLRPIAQDIANLRQSEVRLVKFTQMELLETLTFSPQKEG